MPAASYCVLTHDVRHLKGIGAATASQPDGITVDDLTAAERLAKNAIDGWLLAVARSSRGAAIIVELTAAVEAAVDPEIRNLADLKASAIVWEWYQKRNSGNVARGDAPISQSEELTKQAVEKAAAIERSGILLTAAGTVRRLRYSKWEGGIAYGGPMSSGSLFDPSGLYTDPNGVQHSTPHVEPIEEGGF